MSEMRSLQQVLIYGDGDGRFLAALVRHAPEARITVVDASSEMLRAAARRISHPSRVHLVQADALLYPTAQNSQGDTNCFELVVSHFFLDCFNESELTILLTQVDRMTRQDATWIVSDFAVPRSPVFRALGRWLIGALYIAFGVLTGLKTRRLPDHARVMRDQGWVLEDQRELLGGLLVSQRWRKA